MKKMKHSVFNLYFSFSLGNFFVFFNKKIALFDIIFA